MELDPVIGSTSHWTVPGQDGRQAGPRPEEHPAVPMLSRTGYPHDRIDHARRLVDEHLAAYDALADATTTPAGRSALEAFAPHHLTAVVLVLEQLFAHRSQSQEGKEGNLCNEVRQLARAIVAKGGVIPADEQIELDPSRTATGLGPGDTVVLTRGSVGRLVDGYVAEIRTRFAATD